MADARGPGMFWSPKPLVGTDIRCVEVLCLVFPQGGLWRLSLLVLVLNWRALKCVAQAISGTGSQMLGCPREHLLSATFFLYTPLSPELRIPAQANVFYAKNPHTKPNFVLRKRSLSQKNDEWIQPQPPSRPAKKAPALLRMLAKPFYCCVPGRG